MYFTKNFTTFKLLTFDMNGQVEAITSVRRILEIGGGRKFEIIEDQKKNFSFRIIAFSCPKFGEDQKKGSSLRFSPVFGPKLGEDQKKGFQSDFDRLCAQIFWQNYKGGGACRNFTYYSMPIILSWRPKGGSMAPWPPKYAPGNNTLLPLSASAFTSLPVMHVLS